MHSCAQFRRRRQEDEMHGIALHLYCLILLFLFRHDVFARFTLETCWGNDCVQQNSQGTWCYYPEDTGTNYYSSCTGSQADMTTVLQVHLKQNLSIAYYRGVDNSFLGGADWTVPDKQGIIRICLSGYHSTSGRSGLRTLCTNAAGNNLLANSPYCEVSLGPTKVVDGCYGVEIINITTSASPSATSVVGKSAGVRQRSSWAGIMALIVICIDLSIRLA